MESLMRKVMSRNALLLLGIGALFLMTTAPALAKHASQRVNAETSKSAYSLSARDWKRRHRSYAASRRFVKPRGYARAYYRRAYSRPWASYEIDLLFDCLLSQPFVICP
jgi:hypothetical protein